MAADRLPTVLFVDDDEEVLAGIRSGLRRQRRDYTFLFAVGAEEAFEVFGTTTVDIIVTDMRMPYINGVEVLRWVRQHHPDVVRYVLSGEAEEELVVESVALAHRWLSKPCDREDLAVALVEAVEHRELLTSPIDGPIGVEPPLFAAVHAAMASPKTAPAEVAKLVEGRADVRMLIERWSDGSQVDGLAGIIGRHGLGLVAQVVLLAEIFNDDTAWFRNPGVSPEAIALSCHESGDCVARLSAWFSVVLRDTADLAGHPLGARLLAHWGLPTDLVMGVLHEQETTLIDDKVAS